jgi:hypothetical protein
MAGHDQSRLDFAGAWPGLSALAWPAHPATASSPPVTVLGPAQSWSEHRHAHYSNMIHIRGHQRCRGPCEGNVSPVDRAHYDLIGGTYGMTGETSRTVPGTHPDPPSYALRHSQNGMR